MTNNKQQTEMNKEFIPYELALELKKLGFNEPCLGYYLANTLFISNDIVYNSTDIPVIKAPLYSQAFRWFREKHNWIGGIRNLDTNNQIIVADFVKDEDNSFMIWGESYEDAELKALKELIERIKTN